MTGRKPVLHHHAIDSGLHVAALDHVLDGAGRGELRHRHCHLGNECEYITARRREINLKNKIERRIERKKFVRDEQRFLYA